MWEICEICKKSVTWVKYFKSDIWCICIECNKKLSYKDRQRIWFKFS